jgi:hypothetical protein
MCRWARLSTDYSATWIKLKFDRDYPAPNIPALVFAVQHIADDILQVSPFFMGLTIGRSKLPEMVEHNVNSYVEFGHKARYLFHGTHNKLSTTDTNPS